jgi:hypothetical protein
VCCGGSCKHVAAVLCVENSHSSGAQLTLRHGKCHGVSCQWVNVQCVTFAELFGAFRC